MYYRYDPKYPAGYLKPVLMLSLISDRVGQCEDKTLYFLLH